MSVIYNIPAINARLEGVVDTIDAGSTNGSLRLKANSGTVISTVSLARPCGVVDGGVLTFSGTLLDPSAASTGEVGEADVTDGDGSVVVSGLTVGIPLSGCDVLLTNGLNTTAVTAGQTVEVVSAQITGS